jgi:hypothetical protein
MRHRCVLAVTLLLALTASLRAQPVDTPACKRELADTWAAMENALSRLKSVARASREEKCAVYLGHVDIVTKAREVFGRCKSGREREGDLTHINGALDDLKTILNRHCSDR